MPQKIAPLVGEGNTKVRCNFDEKPGEATQARWQNPDPPIAAGASVRYDAN